MRAEYDLPANAAVLYQLAATEAARYVGITSDEVPKTYEARVFVFAALSHAPARGRAWCRHGEVGAARASAIIANEHGRWNTSGCEGDGRRRFPMTYARALRLAEKLIVVWP